MYLRQSQLLTHAGALIVLQGAIAKAEEMQVPQSIAVVDPSGNLLAFIRMDGAKFLSQMSATHKAVTAASSRAKTGDVPSETATKLALTMGQRFSNLPGGLPIEIDGQVVGAVGAGSGTDDEDVEVSEAGIAALIKALKNNG
ncbi:MAG: heme-binding protein [Phormidesmis sp.]